MGAYQALGTGPVSFLDTNESQHTIPLSWIYFDANGAHATSWPKYAANAAVVDALLKQLVTQKLLIPGTTVVNVPPIPVPALTIAAAAPGAPGNSITVTFSNPQPALAPPTVDVQVTATEDFPGLTLANLAQMLGSSAATATGMVFLNGAANSVPVVQNGPLGADFKFLFMDAANSAAGAFSVEAAVQTPDAPGNITVAITIPPVSPAGSFTLTVSYTNAKAGVSLNTLTTAATNPFAAVVTFALPAANGPLPTAGPVVLTGGAAPSSNPAVAATANVLSS